MISQVDFFESLADGLYQDLLNNKVGSLKINQRDLVSYAYEKKVMIGSPMSLFPMLQEHSFLFKQASINSW